MLIFVRSFIKLKLVYSSQSTCFWIHQLFSEHTLQDRQSLLVLLYDLLWWNLIGGCPHVNLLVNVHTRDDEEHPRALGASHQKTTKPEYDHSLVFLKHRTLLARVH